MAAAAILPSSMEPVVGTGLIVRPVLGRVGRRSFLRSRFGWNQHVGALTLDDVSIDAG